MIARGDLIVGAQRGLLTSKPRPLVVVQNDLAAKTHGSIVVCLITTNITGQDLIRIPLIPTAENGLRDVCEVQVDQLHTFRREALHRSIGRLSMIDLSRVDEALKRWLSI